MPLPEFTKKLAPRFASELEAAIEAFESPDPKINYFWIDELTPTEEECTIITRILKDHPKVPAVAIRSVKNASSLLRQLPRSIVKLAIVLQGEDTSLHDKELEELISLLPKMSFKKIILSRGYFSETTLIKLIKALEDTRIVQLDISGINTPVTLKVVTALEKLADASPFFVSCIYTRPPETRNTSYWFFFRHDDNHKYYSASAGLQIKTGRNHTILMNFPKLAEQKKYKEILELLVKGYSDIDAKLAYGRGATSMIQVAINNDDVVLTHILLYMAQVQHYIDDLLAVAEPFLLENNRETESTKQIKALFEKTKKGDSFNLSDYPELQEAFTTFSSHLERQKEDDHSLLRENWGEAMALQTLPPRPASTTSASTGP